MGGSEGRDGGGGVGGGNKRRVEGRWLAKGGCTAQQGSVSGGSQLQSTPLTLQTLSDNFSKSIYLHCFQLKKELCSNLQCSSGKVLFWKSFTALKATISRLVFKVARKKFILPIQKKINKIFIPLSCLKLFLSKENHLPPLWRTSKTFIKLCCSWPKCPRKQKCWQVNFSAQ